MGIQMLEDGFLGFRLDLDQVVLQSNIDIFSGSDFFKCLAVFLKANREPCADAKMTFAFERASDLRK